MRLAQTTAAIWIGPSDVGNSPRHQSYHLAATGPKHNTGTDTTVGLAGIMSDKPCGFVYGNSAVRRGRHCLVRVRPANACPIASTDQFTQRLVAVPAHTSNTVGFGANLLPDDGLRIVQCTHDATWFWADTHTPGSAIHRMNQVQSSTCSSQHSHCPIPKTNDRANTES
jgi:hypothetical protein